MVLIIEMINDILEPNEALGPIGVESLTGDALLEHIQKFGLELDLGHIDTEDDLKPLNDLDARLGPLARFISIHPHGSETDAETIIVRIEARMPNPQVAIQA